MSGSLTQGLGWKRSMRVGREGVEEREEVRRVGVEGLAEGREEAGEAGGGLSSAIYRIAASWCG